MKAINNILLIGVCGRSRSGKDSVSQKIAGVNKNVLHINMDTFFKDKTGCTYDNSGYECWEHTDVIDFDRLYKVVSSLKCGCSTDIKDRSLWYGPYECKISTDDLNNISVVIVQGYTLLTHRKLAALLDSRIFIEVSDENIQLRRPGQYTKQVVIPVSREYAFQRMIADKLFDSNSYNAETIADDLTTHINEQLNMNKCDRLLVLPSCHHTWAVSPGDLLSDHEWHSIDFNDLKGWVKQRKAEMRPDVTLKGNTFEYRIKEGCYELRLRNEPKKEPEHYRHIFRYTLESTPPKAL